MRYPQARPLHRLGAPVLLPAKATAIETLCFDACQPKLAGIKAGPCCQENTALVAIVFPLAAVYNKRKRLRNLVLYGRVLCTLPRRNAVSAAPESWLRDHFLTSRKQANDHFVPAHGKAF